METANTCSLEALSCNVADKILQVHPRGAASVTMQENASNIRFICCCSALENVHAGRMRAILKPLTQAPQQ